MKTVPYIMLVSLFCIGCNRKEKTPELKPQKPRAHERIITRQLALQTVEVKTFELPNSHDTATPRGHGAIVIEDGSHLCLITAAHLFLLAPNDNLVQRRFIYKYIEQSGPIRFGAITGVKTQLKVKEYVQDAYICTVGKLGEEGAIPPPVAFYGKDAERVGLTSEINTRIGESVTFERFDKQIEVTAIGTSLSFPLIGYTTDNFGHKAIAVGETGPGMSGLVLTNEKNPEYLYVVSGQWEMPPEAAKVFGLKEETTPIILMTEIYMSGIYKIMHGIR